MTEAEELKARIEKARAERAELTRSTAERDEIEALRSQAEAEERALKDERAIAAAVQEHGPIGTKIAVVETRLGAIVVKRANHLHFKRFQDAESLKVVTIEKLVRPCLVYPDVSTFEQIMEELPAVWVPLANAISDLAGAKSKEAAGK